ncbi:Pre-rRNA-processing protein esf1 [Cytospora mali]|uniref:Pre-rRNA-processing protein esf1 n=1 Tax=Cytospora mali TaxID=578113 RepID=A0A194VXB8_CYTMA|nr:Pre-rRNA-processing protein esf1 [Valsa mali]
MSSKQTKKRDGASSNKIKDSRFASFETDPRYALPSKKKSKISIDKRFSRMLKDDDFTATSKVDRYGRKIKSDSRKKALQRLYEEEEDEEEDKIEVEDDDIVQRELEKAEKKYDPARGGGFSSSDEDSDSSDDDESEEEVEVDNAPDMQKYRTQQSEVETGEVTNRIAIVNLDWDNIKSIDLMALFKSFVPISGRIEKVSVYPSEFGKERMQREELEGPPKEIFKKKEGGDEEDSEDAEDSKDDDDDTEDSDEEAKNDLLKESNDEDFNSDALRTYQLDRLRYYYAVMICSDKATAQNIYEATDGSEYLSSSNFLDLRFVPDDVTFDDEPRDECDSVPDNYRPVEFVTDALQHSKVKLTWDMDPEESKRKEAQKNAFSGSRTDIAENDLRAYLASDSEDDEEEEEAFAEPASGVPKLSKKELARKKLREALGLKDEPADKPSKGGPVGDMEITFAPALTEESGKKDPEGETTAERYIRKERERKAKKRELSLANREGANPDADAEAEPQEDLGFDDPFFTAEEPKQASKAQLHKEERRKKREAREAEEKQNATEKAQLELLMADNHDEDDGHLDHFDMNEILKAEKKKNKKKSKKDKEAAAGLQEDFQLDVDDDRFKAVFDDHEFAIDPSNPKFKATSGMKKLLEEGRKKRKHEDDGDGGESRKDKKSKKVKASGGEDLNSLVSAIKKKSGARK